MRKSLLPFILLILLLPACAKAPQKAPASPPAAPPTAPGALPGDRGRFFAGSGNCAICHTNMKDESDADVSTDRLWRSSMMANSARDPYWRAAVRGEVLSNPALQEVIEDKCSTCHMPMARFTAVHEAQGKGVILDEGMTDPDHPLHTFAQDGVSCNLCHQIQPENFGQPESFSGGFIVDTKLPSGEREAFGPYEIAKANAAAMQAVSGFVPQKAAHIEQSELCGTCHTLHTPFVNAQGDVAGEFPEQMVYNEWLNSEYATGDAPRSCQSCHMPEAEGGVLIATTGGPPRSPFYKHYFVGGNTYVPTILQTFGEDLAVTATAEQFQTTMDLAQAQLQNETARLTIENPRLEGDRLRAEIVVESQVGHKFPGGFPSRRVWLHIQVKDANGITLFESGASDPDGAIAGNDNDADPASYEPHYTEITAPGQVQIYEAILQDTEQQVTTVLLKAAGYAKDNRLLPSGFDPVAAHPAIGVYGKAAEDADFAGGGDRLGLSVPLGEFQGPLTLEVELLYQAVGYRWADNLSRFDAPEPQQFLEYYRQVPNLPVQITRVEASIEP